MINTIEVHGINHMHARDDATAIQNNATRGQESKTKKIWNHPVKITGSRGGYQLHQVLRIEREKHGNRQRRG
jgi:hypothetical protein